MVKPEMNNISKRTRIYFLIALMIFGGATLITLWSNMGSVWQPAFSDEQKSVVPSVSDHQLITMTIGSSDANAPDDKKRIKVELVNTQTSVTQGLSGGEQ